MNWFFTLRVKVEKFPSKHGENQEFLSMATRPLVPYFLLVEAAQSSVSKEVE